MKKEKEEKGIAGVYRRQHLLYLAQGEEKEKKM